MRLLIDKAELMRHIENEMREWGEEYDALQILGDIEDFPTADVVVGVIRCKDCKHSRTIPAKLCNTDDDWMVCNFHGRAVVEDDFCSWGERKEE